MKWIFDPTPPSGNDKGESPFGAMLEEQAGKIGNMTSLFVRETISNSADQRKIDNSHPVEINIDFISITGSVKKEFKKSLDWKSLSKHIKAAMGDGNANPTQEKLVKSYANMNDDNEPTVLVRVSDHNANGLTGDELDKSGNFHLFCKSVFKTSNDKGRQGSFGLGKGVFYHQSGINTVLMSSFCNIDGSNQTRAFGRSELQSHETSEGSSYRGTIGCDGPGFFGIEKITDRRTSAVSCCDQPEDNLKKLFLYRDEILGTGTSVISIAYKENMTIETMVANFKSGILKWFWPALSQTNKPISITIRTFNNHDHDEELDQKVKLTDEYKSFARAFNDQEDSKDLNDIGSLAAKERVWNIPNKKQISASDNETWNDGTSFQANGMVKVYRSSASGECQHHELKNHIALLRNNLCVVEYEQIKVFSDDTSSYFYGVFKGGESRGDSKEDRKFSDFLRSAEPPLHNHWKYAPKIDAIYAIEKPTTFLRNLTADILEAANELADVQEINQSDNLDHLASLFQFGKSGIGDNKRLISYKILDSSLVGRNISAKIEVNNLKEEGATWDIDTFFTINEVNSSENNLILDNVVLDNLNLKDNIITLHDTTKCISMKIDPTITKFSYTVNAIIPQILDDDLAQRQDYKITVVSRN